MLHFWGRRIEKSEKEDNTKTKMVASNVDFKENLLNLV